MRANGDRHARCPNCSGKVWMTADVELWDIIICTECDTELQVVNLSPPELDYVWEDEWEEEGYEDEEDYEGYAVDEEEDYEGHAIDDED